MPDWKSKRDSRRSSVARGLAKGKNWGLPPLKARPNPEPAFPRGELTGTVSSFKTEHGFGFAEFDGLLAEQRDKRAFVHNSNVISPAGGKMRKGSRIKAGVIPTERGPRAVNIKIIGAQ